MFRLTQARVTAERERPPPPAGASQADFVARLQLVARQWPSIDRLAKAAGVSPSAFRKWLKGEAEPSRSRLVALAAATGVGMSWLAQGEGAAPDLHGVATRAFANQRPERARQSDAGRLLFLPRQLQGPTIDAGCQAPDLSNEAIGFRHGWLRATFDREPGDLLLEIAAGDAMEPGIRDNDTLLIDTTNRKLKFRDFGIYLIEVRGERVVRRMQCRMDGSLVLISDNKAYQPEPVSAELAAEVHVVGRVVWRGGSL